MELLTGEHHNTLDDKGRVSLPSRLRGCLRDNVLVLTKGLERCVWVFPPERWEIVSEKLMAPGTLSVEKSSWLQHRFIVPAQIVEIDKNGRVAVPQSLRDYAGLSKECVVCGLLKYMEIWSVEEWAKYNDVNEINSKEIMEELGAFSLLT
jgi:MraZ protein